jgi:CRISPR/Cas system-associated endoribonuclease Cas2
MIRQYRIEQTLMRKIPKTYEFIIMIKKDEIAIYPISTRHMRTLESFIIEEQKD